MSINLSMRINLGRRKNKQENEHDQENHDLSHLTKKKVHNHEYAFEYDTEIAYGLTSSLLEV